MNKTKISCLIIDDDPFIQELLLDKLTVHFPDVKVVGIASNGQIGLYKIREEKPDLVFLDVEMPDMTGFELLEKTVAKFKTIFITSYSHYAIKAIRHNALDYLVKPIDLEELHSAIDRFKKTASPEFIDRKLIASLAKQIQAPIASERLILQTQSDELNIKINRIIRVEGERNYSNIYLENGSKKIISKTLGYFEESLKYNNFFRCHKSHLVNYNHIKTVLTSELLLLSDNMRVPISRRRKNDFKHWFSKSMKVA